MTAHAGLPLVIEAFRALGLGQATGEHLHFKQRVRGYAEVTFVETLVALLAAGGECVDDVRVLQADPGLQRLWGKRALPAAETLRGFLNRFHDQAAVGARVAHTAFVPADSAGLRALGAVQQQLLRALQARAPQRHATLDVDTNVIASAKRTALPVYEGGTGYQPLGVWWAEQGLWVTSQFRDGNVPAQSGVLEMVQASVARLESLGVTAFALRSDSAGYQHVLLDWALPQGQQPLGGRGRQAGGHPASRGGQASRDPQGGGRRPGPHHAGERRGSTAAESFFKERAEVSKKLDVLNTVLAHQTKFIVPAGADIVNVLGLDDRTVVPVRK